MTCDNEKQEQQLVPALYKSLFENGLDLTSDLFELPIDLLTENEIVKQIPIVGSIVKLGKITISIRDRYLLKKTICFIAEINKGIIKKEKLYKHRDKLKADKKLMEKELEQLLITLERFNNIKKSIVFANFYNAYIDDSIDFDWVDFCIFAEILEHFSIYDYMTLQSLGKEISFDDTRPVDRLALSRMSSLGIADFFSGIKVSARDSEFVARITPVGELFLELGFKNERGEYVEL